MKIREMMKLLKIDTIHINNIEYLTIKNFCRISNQSPQNISKLCRVGNRYGEKLKFTKIDTKTLIPFSELFDYNFVDRRGRCYSMNENGEIVKKAFPLGF